MRWLVGVLLVTGCGGGWTSDAALIADPRRVAEALGDPPGEHDAPSLPVLGEPSHPRPCCAFGMDMHVDFASIAVPFFEVGNVISVDELGRHAYATVVPEVEGNGLVYTCRGGWIDVAHVRENADVVLYLTLSFAPILGEGGTVRISGHGAPTTIVLDPLPASAWEDDPLRVASLLAAWVTWRIGIWHEVATWWGYQMIAGFSEQPSAFSPEDLYSNALGIRLGRAVIEAGRFESDAVYQTAIAAYVHEALVRLGAVDRETARSIMHALDGRWWDSAQRLPHPELVLRRAFPDAGPQVRPWRAIDAFDEGFDLPVLRVCAGADERPLALSSQLDGRPISERVHVVVEPEAWAREGGLPSTDPSIVSEGELDTLVARTHEAMEAVLGEGFDAPRGPIAGPPPVE
jgi:hypothetical protein